MNECIINSEKEAEEKMDTSPIFDPFIIQDKNFLIDQIREAYLPLLDIHKDIDENQTKDYAYYINMKDNHIIIGIAKIQLII